ncbi:TIGR00296 family protein [Candidatus Woesearchaeota archaeon]|nr:TIGR00296 family protein [Candidatus Woesearchaeota archaeon]RLE42343.1 MAG: TIGR00296 family protein [Candidatus Woesearchaeota archaeon]
MISSKDGELLVRLARETIVAHFSGKQVDIAEYRERFNEKRGCFVTLTKRGALRGCIGYPLPIYPLWQGIMKAAIAAAFQDPRFPSLKEEELEDIEVEVSVLTQPQLIRVNDPKDYPKAITIGKHGLIIELGWNSGLLLPQVATEYNWSPEEFLENLCLKAGLRPGCWKEPGAKVYSFEALVFSERKESKS